MTESRSYASQLENKSENGTYTSPSNLVLLYDNINPKVRSVLMVMNKLDVSIPLRFVDTLSGEHMTKEYKQINPASTVPTLIDDNLVLFTSPAILVHLVSTYNGTDLYPCDFDAQMKIMNMLFFDLSVLYRRHGAYMTALIRSGSKSKVDEFHGQRIIESYQVLEDILSNTCYMASDKISLADYGIMGTMSGLDILFPLENYSKQFPKLWTWFSGMQALPEYSGEVKAGVEKEKLFIQTLSTKLNSPDSIISQDIDNIQENSNRESVDNSDEAKINGEKSQSSRRSSKKESRRNSLEGKTSGEKSQESRKSLKKEAGRNSVEGKMNGEKESRKSLKKDSGRNSVEGKTNESRRSLKKESKRNSAASKLDEEPLETMKQDSVANSINSQTGEETNEEEGFEENQMEENQMEDNQMEDNQMEDNQMEENQMEVNQLEVNQMEVESSKRSELQTNSNSKSSQRCIDLMSCPEESNGESFAVRESQSKRLSMNNEEASRKGSLQSARNDHYLHRSAQDMRRPSNGKSNSILTTDIETIDLSKNVPDYCFNTGGCCRESPTCKCRSILKTLEVSESIETNPEEYAEEAEKQSSQAAFPDLNDLDQICQEYCSETFEQTTYEIDLDTVESKHISKLLNGSEDCIDDNSSCLCSQELGLEDFNCVQEATDFQICESCSQSDGDCNAEDCPCLAELAEQCQSVLSPVQTESVPEISGYDKDESFSTTTLEDEPFQSNIKSTKNSYRESKIPRTNCLTVDKCCRNSPTCKCRYRSELRSSKMRSENLIEKPIEEVPKRESSFKETKPSEQFSAPCVDGGKECLECPMCKCRTVRRSRQCLDENVPIRTPESRISSASNKYDEIDENENEEENENENEDEIEAEYENETAEEVIVLNKKKRCCKNDPVCICNNRSQPSGRRPTACCFSKNENDTCNEGTCFDYGKCCTTSPDCRCQSQQPSVMERRATPYPKAESMVSRISEKQNDTIREDEVQQSDQDDYLNSPKSFRDSSDSSGKSKEGIYNPSQARSSTENSEDKYRPSQTRFSTENSEDQNRLSQSKCSNPDCENKYRPSQARFSTENSEDKGRPSQARFSIENSEEQNRLSQSKCSNPDCENKYRPSQARFSIENSEEQNRLSQSKCSNPDCENKYRPSQARFSIENSEEQNRLSQSKCSNPDCENKYRPSQARFSIENSDEKLRPSQTTFRKGNSEANNGPSQATFRKENSDDNYRPSQTTSRKGNSEANYGPSQSTFRKENSDDNYRPSQTTSRKGNSEANYGPSQSTFRKENSDDDYRPSQTTSRKGNSEANYGPSQSTFRKENSDDYYRQSQSKCSNPDCENKYRPSQDKFSRRNSDDNYRPSQTTFRKGNSEAIYGPSQSTFRKENSDDDYRPSQTTSRKGNSEANYGPSQSTFRKENSDDNYRPSQGKCSNDNCEDKFRPSQDRFSRRTSEDKYRPSQDRFSKEKSEDKYRVSQSKCSNDNCEDKFRPSQDRFSRRTSEDKYRPSQDRFSKEKSEDKYRVSQSKCSNDNCEEKFRPSQDRFSRRTSEDKYRPSQDRFSKEKNEDKYRVSQGKCSNDNCEDKFRPSQDRFSGRNTEDKYYPPEERKSSEKKMNRASSIGQENINESNSFYTNKRCRNNSSCLCKNRQSEQTVYQYQEPNKSYFKSTNNSILENDRESSYKPKNINPPVRGLDDASRCLCGSYDCLARASAKRKSLAETNQGFETLTETEQVCPGCQWFLETMVKYFEKYGNLCSVCEAFENQTMPPCYCENKLPNDFEKTIQACNCFCEGKEFEGDAFPIQLQTENPLIYFTNQTPRFFFPPNGSEFTLKPHLSSDICFCNKMSTPNLSSPSRISNFSGSSSNAYLKRNNLLGYLQGPPSIQSSRSNPILPTLEQHLQHLRTNQNHSNICLNRHYEEIHKSPSYDPQFRRFTRISGGEESQFRKMNQQLSKKSKSISSSSDMRTEQTYLPLEHSKGFRKGFKLKTQIPNKNLAKSETNPLNLEERLGIFIPPEYFLSTESFDLSRAKGSSVSPFATTHHHLLKKLLKICFDESCNGAGRKSKP